MSCSGVSALAKLGSDDQQRYLNFVLSCWDTAVAKFSTWELRTCKEKKEKKRKEKKRRKSFAKTPR
jgi:hypothetical protein